jgi:hypothetical protein
MDGSESEEIYTITSLRYGPGLGAVMEQIGDVNGDGIADLAVGVPGEPVGSKNGAGKAYIVGGAEGKMIEQMRSPNPEQGGAFGSSIARIGDVSGDGVPDLAISAEESVRGISEAGRVYVFAIPSPKPVVSGKSSPPSSGGLENTSSPGSARDELHEESSVSSTTAKMKNEEDDQPSAKIIYHLDKSAHVSVKVYDLLGRRIATLVDRQQSAGGKIVYLSESSKLSSELDSGNKYFYRVEAGDSEVKSGSVTFAK